MLYHHCCSAHHCQHCVWQMSGDTQVVLLLSSCLSRSQYLGEFQNVFLCTCMSVALIRLCYHFIVHAWVPHACEHYACGSVWALHPTHAHTRCTMCTCALQAHMHACHLRISMLRALYMRILNEQSIYKLTTYNLPRGSKLGTTNFRDCILVLLISQQAQLIL